MQLFWRHLCWTLHEEQVVRAKNGRALEWSKIGARTGLTGFVLRGKMRLLALCENVSTGMAWEQRMY